MKPIITIIALLNLFLLSGCSSETIVAEEFKLPAGASISIRTDIQSKYSDNGLYFFLRGIPDTKKERDFSDFISVELIDGKGGSYHPWKIRDINGSKRDIVASFSGLPKRVHIKTIKISALQDLEGSRIRWWSGRLK